MDTTCGNDARSAHRTACGQTVFCVIPWTHRQINEQGYHQLCCLAVGDGNSLRNERGELLHVSQRLTNEQVLNSPGVKSVRKQMMNGEWPATCERCRQSEEAGSHSVRQQLNSYFGVEPDSLLQQTREDGSLDRPIVRYADIRLGNVCNLSCRMCGPYASSLWSKYFNDVQPDAYRLSAEQLRVFSENWVKREPLAWLFAELLPSVERLHFAGGEALIVPEMVDVLRQCIASGRADEINLSYNTNLTVLPEKVTELWPHFRGVEVQCSVDGYDSLNDYIRRPSHWRDIDRNLRTLDRRYDEWKIRRAAVNTTFQIYNALSIHELFEYMRNASFERLEPLPLLIPLYYPHYLSAQCLPAHVKTLVRELLQVEIARAEEWNRPDLAVAIGCLRATIAFVDAADTSANLANFFAFCERSDRTFGDSWREAAPALASYLKPVS